MPELSTGPGLGHNEAPLTDLLQDRLDLDHEDLIARKDELVAAEDRVPECTDEAAAKKIGDYIKQLSACMKDGEGRRVKEKEPYLESSRRVDGFFKNVKETLDKIKSKCNAQLTTYQKEVARKERIALAAQAEADAKAAADAARVAEEALELATSDANLENAVEKEEEAIEAAETASVAEKAAEQSAADLSRTRSSAGGSVSSLTTFWAFRAFDKATIDLDVLRPFLTDADIEKALKAYIKSGGRDIKGAIIFEDQKSVVR